MKTKKIILTGAPATGKTTLLHAMQKKGFRCFSEIARTLIIEANTQDTGKSFTNNPLAFSTCLLKKRIEQYQKADNHKDEMVFIDRGIPDVIAYLDFKKTAYPKHFIRACKTHTYQEVFLLPPWQEIYTTDNQRQESYSQALQIHQHLVDTYTKYGYSPITVAPDTVDNRVAFILKYLQKNNI